MMAAQLVARGSGLSLAFFVVAMVLFVLAAAVVRRSSEMYYTLLAVGLAATVVGFIVT